MKIYHQIYDKTNQVLGMNLCRSTVDKYLIFLNSFAEPILLLSAVEKSDFVTLSERTTDGFVNSWLSSFCGRINYFCLQCDVPWKTQQHDVKDEWKTEEFYLSMFKNIRRKNFTFSLSETGMAVFSMLMAIAPGSRLWSVRNVPGLSWNFRLPDGGSSALRCEYKIHLRLQIQ